MAYLTKTTFGQLTLAPRSYIEEIESQEPQWIDRTLVHWSEWIDDQLRKRYAVPFSEPYPRTVVTWLVALVTPLVYAKVGVDASADPQFALIMRLYETAFTDIQAAANSKDGLFELPLNAGSVAAGITKTAPLVHTEASPYQWQVVQAEAGRLEDDC